MHLNADTDPSACTEPWIMIVTVVLFGGGDSKWTVLWLNIERVIHNKFVVQIIFHISTYVKFNLENCKNFTGTKIEPVIYTVNLNSWCIMHRIFISLFGVVAKRQYSEGRHVARPRMGGCISARRMVTGDGIAMPWDLCRNSLHEMDSWKGDMIRNFFLHYHLSISILVLDKEKRRGANLKF